ncbi:MAG: hypothetical protein CHACPFDD_01754 [Phycisphaerae bacterium]|nr:hypothetical protein [Phycisphaerae bacterium]
MLLAGGALLAALCAASCAGRGERYAASSGRLPDSGSPAVALGNLRVGSDPSPGQVELVRFLFGEEPDPTLGLIKPVDVALFGDQVLACDAALLGILRADTRAGYQALPIAETPRLPAALAVHGDSVLLADAAGAVLRFDARGGLRQRYALPADTRPFRPSGLLVLDDELWIANAAAHTLEIFGLERGELRRSIGGRGSGPGRFAVPVGLAATPEGQVCAVDMLGCRVEVFDRAGVWQRDIGGPGDRLGRFGRPRDVAVGPDGVVFVSDAASQRVHAFSPAGTPLAMFGGPEDGDDALVLPGGLAIAACGVAAERAAPPGFEPRYCVLVAEQIARPGIRVFAWRGPQGDDPRSSSVAATRPPPTVANPHWTADGCGSCHETRDGVILPIEPRGVDALCLKCHDGEQAIDEPHPIGRPAAGSRTQAPPDWPLIDGRLTCLTCHDIRRHCDAAAIRPMQNSALVRGFDAQAPTRSCTQCHTAELWRINPHRAQSSEALDRAACTFCHTHATELDRSGVRRGDARLRDSSSGLCLTCHTMHADPAPRGHLGAELTSAVQAALERPGSAGRLPMSDERVTCFSCHNPHAAETFPAGTPLAIRSDRPEDAKKSLRAAHIELCLHCHPR